MFRLIQIEFFKLRRRNLIWIMLLGAFVMPFFAMLYFRVLGKTDVEPVLFYKWSAFGCTLFFILPFILGVLCTILMHDENRYDMPKQLWIVPVCKMGYFFGKFAVVLAYSVCFMLATALASVLFSVAPGYVELEWGSVIFLLEKCMEIAFGTAFAVLPILAVAASRKEYLLPVCATLLYALLGFFLMPVNMYLHPIASVCALVIRNGEIPGMTLTQKALVLPAILCIGIWDIFGVVLAKRTLGRRK